MTDSENRGSSSSNHEKSGRIGSDNQEKAENIFEKAEIRDMEFIKDVSLKVSVELGRTILTIKDLLQLGNGSVIELEKLAGEPLEILVNGREVAKGEVVVINEKFGIRLTDIIDPSNKG